METNTTIPSYRAGFKELRQQLIQALPSEALTSFDAYATELQGSMKSILKVKPGEKAPEFSLVNQSDEAVTLSGLLKKGSVILVFYRGSWCPYCNLQLNQLQSILPELKSREAQLVAVSPQTPDMSLSFAEKNNLQFEVLSDVGNGVAAQYTTVFKHKDKATSVLRSLGIDFESHYGDDSNELPVPAVFVIRKNGMISFAKSEGGDYRNRVEIAEILEAI